LRTAARDDKLAANILALVKLAAIRIWLRVYESTSWMTQASTFFLASDEAVRRLAKPF
jgi:hypothetical protein